MIELATATARACTAGRHCAAHRVAARPGRSERHRGRRRARRRRSSGRSCSSSIPARREDHTDISVQFACSVRYITNAPLDHGSSTTITLRLGPDCGTRLSSVAPELPLVGGGGELVTGARVDSVVPGEVTLELSWSRDLDFVMAPTANGLGLRVRLLGTGKRKRQHQPAGSRGSRGLCRQSRVLVQQVRARGGGGRRRRACRPRPTCPRPTSRNSTGTGCAWGHSRRAWRPSACCRLRGRPIRTRGSRINDEQTDLTRRSSAPARRRRPAGARPIRRCPDDERAANPARGAQRRWKAISTREAVDLLTRLLRQPEYPARADAQELIGLVRERAGQLAQAKAEYEEYLRRYPDGAGPRPRARTAAGAGGGLACAEGDRRVRCRGAQAAGPWPAARR